MKVRSMLRASGERSLPGEIRTALLPVCRDLAAADVALAIEALPRRFVSTGTEHAQVRIAGRVVGEIGIDLANTTAARVWHLADQLQEYVLETPWGSGRAVTWPYCLAGHPHPMAAKLLANDAWWICPGGSATRVRIGAHPGRALVAIDSVDS